MTKTEPHHDKKPPLVRRPHPTRDLIEGILTALVLALIIRHYVFEVFQIPTGSMAPTLLGQHRDLHCPNCGLRFPVDASESENGTVKVIKAACPNCYYEFAEDVVRRTYCTCFPAKPVRLFWRGSNRVIANKFLNRFHPPKRWEVVVFKYPLVDLACKDCGATTRNVKETNFEQCPTCGSHNIRVVHKNYIKRVVGLPNETIEIRHGDIYANGSIQRKPDTVQKDLWQFVHDSAFQPNVEDPRLRPRWVAAAGSFFQDPDSGALELTPGADGRAIVRYGRKIKNLHPYNDINRNVNLNLAGDLRWTVTARLKEAGKLILELSEDKNRYHAEVSFGLPGGGGTILKENGNTVADSAFTADVDLEHEIAFSNVDDRLELIVDGSVILSYEFDIPPGGVPYNTKASGASLAVEGTKATLSRVIMARDIYYTRDGGEFQYAPSTQIPKDAYYVLGDNSRNSQDSRYWGFVPSENLIGEAVVVWWPLSHLKAVR